jgi:Fe-S-cluster-containing dehydrogenase component
MDVCPVSAITRDTEGVVHLDPSICVGCRACTIVCPYGAISMVDGKFVKCDHCGGEPKCVEWCPTGALEYTVLQLADMPRRRMIAETLAKPILRTREQKG